MMVMMHMIDRIKIERSAPFVLDRASSVPNDEQEDASATFEDLSEQIRTSDTSLYPQKKEWTEMVQKCLKELKEDKLTKVVTKTLIFQVSSLISMTVKGEKS